MSHNITQATVAMPTADQQHQHLKEVYEHLRHASTSDAPEEVRERLRRTEVALQRYQQQDGTLKN